MPFDSAEFLPLPLPDRSVIPTTKIEWRRRLRSLFAPKGKSPEREALVTLRMLGEAKELIAARQNWTQGIYKTLSGKYCAVGALGAVSRRLRDAGAQSTAHDLLLAVARQRGFRTIEALNDASSHEQVLAAFDEAIALARRRAAVSA